MQLNAPIEEVWSFFSRPENLNELTPSDMSFEIISDIKDKEMHQGMIVAYNIKPILNIPFTWVTEISHMEKFRMFIDEQRFGPYKFWHHQHHFEKNAEGVLMTDILHYVPPFGFLGTLMNKVFIADKIQGIFEYRTEKVLELFS